jgi:hypothetical protein
MFKHPEILTHEQHPMRALKHVIFGVSALNPPIQSMSGIVSAESKVDTPELVVERMARKYNIRPLRQHELTETHSWGSSASECSSCINNVVGSHLNSFDLIQPYCYIPTNYQASENQLLSGAHQQTADNNSPIAMLNFTSIAITRRGIEVRQNTLSPELQVCYGEIPTEPTHSILMHS